MTDRTAPAWPVVLHDGWRVFFLAGGMYGVAAIAIWLWWLMGGDALPFMPSPTAWHAHEMIFGFASAALAGFFLTAVPNWTGARAAPERFVALVAALWLAGRLAVWFSGALHPALVAVVDLAFVPVLAAKLLTQMLKRPKAQNMMFLVILVLVWSANLLVHLDWIGLTATEPQGLRGGLLSICAMIAVLGGRITPAFTRNALLRENEAAAVPVSRAFLDRAGIASAILTAVMAISGAPAVATGIVSLVAGVTAALRLGGWRTAATLRVPIVWALHAGYGLLALGLVAWGLSLLGLGPEVGALHILGIGAVGGMTLAVMSRASLGHAGLPLVAPASVAFAYALIPLAVALRWAAAGWPDAMYYVGSLGAGLLWIVAFTLYLIALWPVWTRPRKRREAST